jgi:NAD(P) transhydrogenase subunit alpha|tara:strand:+ start:4713 stop:5831 length:1119 start_codon:yes stop_codon:yes gene_type:complete
MIVSALKERKDNEKRVAIVPDVVKKLINDGHQVLIESGAGEQSFFSNEAYIESGAEISSLDDIVLKTDILLVVDLPSDEILSKMKDNSNIVGLLNPYDNNDSFEWFKNKSISAFSMELIPRITRAQSMDVLSSQANLSGYRAVINATSLYSKSMAMMMTAAGTVAPAKVFIMGVGVAGLQAIATAKRLGAVVSATDVRRAAAEQCESLGASFIMVEDEDDAEDESGYAKEMSEEYKEKQRQLIADHVKQQDIIICSALIPGKEAPTLLDDDAVKSMKPGSIIIDMAIERGGNCTLSQAGEIIDIEGVSIVGDISLINGISPDASNLFSKNLYAFLDILIDKDTKNLVFDDEIAKDASITINGELSEKFKNLG